MTSNNYYFLVRIDKIIGVYLYIENIEGLLKNTEVILKNVENPDYTAHGSLTKDDLVFEINSSENSKKIYVYDGERFNELEDIIPLTKDELVFEINNIIKNIQESFGEQKYIDDQPINDNPQTFDLFNKLIRVFEFFVDDIVTNPTILKINSLKYHEFNAWLNINKKMNILISNNTQKIPYKVVYEFLKKLLYIRFEKFQENSNNDQNYTDFMTNIYYDKIISKQNNKIGDENGFSVHIKDVANIFKEIYKIVEDNIKSSEHTYRNIVNKIIYNILTKIVQMYKFFNKPLSGNIYPSDVIKNFDENNSELTNSLNVFINQNSSKKILTLLKINCYPLTIYNRRFEVYLKKDKLQTTNYDNSIVIQYNDKNVGYYDNNGELKINLPDPLHKKNYVFGNFSKIYTPEMSNTYIVKHIPNIIEQIESGKPVFIMGYGASGSGKTSSLIYLHYTDKDGNEIKNDGIIIELCKILATNGYTNIELTTKELGDSLVPKNNCMINTNTVFNNNMFNNNIPCVSNFTYDDDTGQFLYKDQSISNFMYNVFEKERFIRPTANNPISSRTHVIAYLKFTNPKQNKNTGYLIVGDLAGIENRFNEENLSTVIDFFNKYKDDIEYQNAFNSVLNELKEKSFEKYSTDTYLGGGQTVEFWKENFNKLVNLDNVTKNMLEKLNIPKKAQFDKISNWYITNREDLNNISKKTSNNTVKYYINYLNDKFESALDEYNNTVNDKMQKEIIAKEQANQRKAQERQRKADAARKAAEIERQRNAYAAREAAARERQRTADAARKETARKEKEDKEQKYKEQKDKKQKLLEQRREHMKYILWLTNTIKIDNNFLVNVLKQYEFMDYQTSYTNLTAIFGNKVNNWLKTIFDIHLKDFITNDSGNFILNMEKINTISTSIFQKQLEETIKLLGKNIDVKEFNNIKKDFDNKYITNKNIGNINTGYGDKTDKGSFENLTFTGNRIKVLEEIKEYIKNNPNAKISKNILNITINNMQINNYLNDYIVKDNTEYIQNIHYSLLFENEQKNNDINKNIKNIHNILNTLHDIFYILKIRIDKGVTICKNRIKEGEYINNSLENSREDIKNIFHHKSKDDMFSSPEFINQCLTKYCPTHSDCFSKKNNENISYELKSTIFQEIHAYLLNNAVLSRSNESIKDLFDKILVCVFCVFNISRSANNPPPTPYIDINELKTDVMKYNKNKDDMDIRNSLAKNIAKTFYKITGEKMVDKVSKNGMSRYDYDGEETFDDTQTLYIKNSESFKFLFTHDTNKNEWYSKFIEHLISEIYTDESQVIQTDESQVIQNQEAYKKYEDNLIEFINCIDKNNTVSAIGTLEFLDKISKYFATNVICSVDTKEYDFRKDYKPLYQINEK